MTEPNKTIREKLSKQPLVLVLAQIRFTPISLESTEPNYMTKIQDQLRKVGFPIQEKVPGKHISILPGNISETESHSWIFRSSNNASTVILDKEQLVLIATEYDGFKVDFLPKLNSVSKIVFESTEHDEVGYVGRVGLRYIDLISDGTEDYTKLLKSAFCGPDSNQFKTNTSTCASEVSGIVDVSSKQGVLRAKVIQNRLGYDVPPDLVHSLPQFYQSKARKGQLATILDVDSFWEVQPGENLEKVNLKSLKRIFEALHLNISDFFRNDAVTSEALLLWK